MKPYLNLTGLWLAAVALTVQAAAPNILPLGSLAQTLRGPARVAADAAGHLYVTDPAAGRVVVFDAFGQQIAAHDGFAGPLAIAVAGDGRIYLSEEQNGSVSVFDPQWNRLYQLGAGTNEFQLPGNLAVDPRAPDLVYVSDGAANLVRVFNGAAQTGEFGGAGADSGQFAFPAGIFVRTNGEVFVVDQNNDRVQVFTNAVFERQFPLGSGGMFGGPSGRSQALLVDRADRVFVTETMSGVVNIFDANTGAALGSLGGFGAGAGQLNLPVGVVLDGFNRLCVAAANNARVELFGVDDFLHLSAQPASGTIAAGNNLVFSVTAGGTNQAGVQWQRNGVNLAGATNATLTVAGAATGDSGNYSVVISGAFGVITSSVAPVTVLVAPAIQTGPASQNVLVGATVQLGVIAAGSSLNFQWQFNGQDLAGATNATLTLASVQAAQSGQYAVRAGNAVGSLTSAPAILTVVAPPGVMDLVALSAQPGQASRLTMNVDPGFVYALDATTNLLDWQTITNFADATGLFDYADMDTTNYASRFYRLRWAP